MTQPAVKPLLPRVRSVAVEPRHVLLVEFQDGKLGRFDVEPLMRFAVYARLAKDGLFAKAHVERGTVVWDDITDMSPDTLYLRCVPVEQEAATRPTLGQPQRV